MLSCKVYLSLLKASEHISTGDNKTADVCAVMTKTEFMTRQFCGNPRRGKGTPSWFPQTTAKHVEVSSSCAIRVCCKTSRCLVLPTGYKGLFPQTEWSPPLGSPRIEQHAQSLHVLKNHRAVSARFRARWGPRVTGFIWQFSPLRSIKTWDDATLQPASVHVGKSWEVEADARKRKAPCCLFRLELLFL